MVRSGEYNTVMSFFGGKIAPALLVPALGASPQVSVLNGGDVIITNFAPDFEVASSNPFGDFFVGVGSLGRLNFDAAIPHASVLSGDILYALSKATSLAGWFVVQSVPVNGFTCFGRVATGTSADEIAASLCGNFGTQIWAVRPNASFSTTGSKSVVTSVGTSVNLQVPANPLLGFEPGTFARMMFYAAEKSGLGAALTIDTGGNFTQTAEIVDNTFKFVAIFGMNFHVPSAAESAFTIPYTTSGSSSQASTSWAQIMSVL